MLQHESDPYERATEDFMKIQKRKNQHYFIIEGNIGAGKSTFLQFVAKDLPIKPIFEPHHKWQNVSGKYNLLEQFYKDTSRWAYTFQSYAFITRVMAQQEVAAQFPTSTQVLERSVYSDRYCFAKNAYENGNMTALEWKLYQEWFSWLVDSYVPRPAGFIYLQTSPEVCFKRLIKRSRHEEVGVSLAYLQQLHDKHENWLINKRPIDTQLEKTPVLVLECNKEFESDKKVRDALITKVSDFILQTHTLPMDNQVISALL